MKISRFIDNTPDSFPSVFNTLGKLLISNVIIIIIIIIIIISDLHH